MNRPIRSQFQPQNSSQKHFCLSAAPRLGMECRKRATETIQFYSGLGLGHKDAVEAGAGKFDADDLLMQAAARLDVHYAAARGEV